MRKKIFPLSPITCVVFLIVLACLLSVGLRYYHLHLQLQQARRTISLLKDMAAWPYEEEKKELRDAEDTYITSLPELYVYSTQVYFSEDTQLKVISTQTHTYLLAFSQPSLFDDIIYALYVVLPENKLYCLAYPDSSDAKSFCRKLGAAEQVPVKLDWYAPIEGFVAYDMQSVWTTAKGLLDAPIDVWKYKSEDPSLS